MEARRLGHNVYDIFFGKQFSQTPSAQGLWGWTRVRQGKNSTYVVAGDKVDHRMLKWLHSVLAPNMPITYGQDINTMLHNVGAIQ